MEEPNDTQIGRVETFYKAIADSLQGETPTLDKTYCRTEEWLAYIASLIQSGGTGGGSGTTDYNQLTNKPFTNLTGTDESPIYLRELATGGYVLNGTCSPYNGSDIYMGANNAITFVNYFDEVTAIQIFYPPYNQVQYFEIYDDHYTTNTVYLNKTENIDNKVTTISESSTDTEYPSALAVKNYINGTILYENSSGNNSNINLSDNFSNYSFVEIYYSSSNVRYENSLKIQGSATAFSVILGEPWSNGIEVSSARYTISESTLTLELGRKVAVPSGTITDSNFIYIKKIIGYK